MTLLASDKDDGQGDLFGDGEARPSSSAGPKPPRLSKIITIADIAKARGVGRTTAREWLLALDAKSGGKVVLRVSSSPTSKIYTTIARLHAADCGWVEAREIEHDEIADLKRKNAALELELRRLKTRTRDMLRAMRPDPDADGNDRD